MLRELMALKKDFNWKTAFGVNEDEELDVSIRHPSKMEISPGPKSQKQQNHSRHPSKMEGSPGPKPPKVHTVTHF